MPSGSGHELAEGDAPRHVAADHLHVRLQEETVACQALLSGRARFLEKPFTPAALLVAAREAVGQRP
jgi:hypothetical protein